MNKDVYYPEGPANSVQPIALGGTGAKTVEMAADNLGLLTNDTANQPNGPLLLNATGVVGDDQLPPDLLSSASPLLHGTPVCFPNGIIVFKVTNFDAFTTYTVSSDSGTVSMLADEITFVAGAEPKTGAIIVNGFSFPITIQKPGVQKPTLLFPVNGAQDTALTLSLEGSSFSVTGMTDTHFSSEWEIATDPSFTNIAMRSVDDQVNKKTISTGRLTPSTNFFARVRYIGLSTGASDWSDITMFATGTGMMKGIELAKVISTEASIDDFFGSAVALNGAGDRLAVGAAYNDPNNHLNAGSIEVFHKSADSYIQRALMKAFGPLLSANLHVAQGGSIRVLADNPGNFDQYYLTDAGVTIPDGAKTVIFNGRGSVGVNGADVNAIDQALTGSGNLTIAKGVTTLTLKGKGGPGTSTYNPGQAYVAPTSSVSWVGYNGNAGWDNAGATTTTNPGYPAAGSDPDPAVPATGGVEYISSTIYQMVFLGQYTPVRRHIISQLYTNPGQPYIAPSTTDYPGASTTATINGQSYNFAGGNGSTPAAETTHVVTLPGSSALPLVYNVVSGGTLSAKHAAVTGAIIPVTQTISGNGTITIPVEVSRYQITGEGGDGTSTSIELHWQYVATTIPGMIPPTAVPEVNNGPGYEPTFHGERIWTWRYNPAIGNYELYEYFATNVQITVGANSTITVPAVGGTTSTFPGGNGIIAIPSTLEFTKPSAETVDISYQIANGKTASVTYIIEQLNNAVAVSVNVSGNASISIPDGIITVIMTGKGGAGETIVTSGQGVSAYPNGLPAYVAAVPEEIRWTKGQYVNVPSGNWPGIEAVGGENSTMANVFYQALQPYFYNFDPVTGPQRAWVTLSLGAGQQQIGGVPKLYDKAGVEGTEIIWPFPAAGLEGCEIRVYWNYLDPLNNQHSGYVQIPMVKTIIPAVAQVGNPTYPSGLPVYVLPNTTLSYGADTTATLNGVTYTFPGGHGGIAAESSQTAMIPAAGVKTLTHSVAASGSLRVDYSQPAAVEATVLNLTGSSSFVIPNGVSSIVMTGKGSAGTAVSSGQGVPAYPNGLPAYVAPGLGMVSYSLGAAAISFTLGSGSFSFSPYGGNSELYTFDPTMPYIYPQAIGMSSLGGNLYRLPGTDDYRVLSGGRICNSAGESVTLGPMMVSGSQLLLSGTVVNLHWELDFEETTGGVVSMIGKVKIPMIFHVTPGTAAVGNPAYPNGLPPYIPAVGNAAYPNGLPAYVAAVPESYGWTVTSGCVSNSGITMGISSMVTLPENIATNPFRKSFFPHLYQSSEPGQLEASTVMLSWGAGQGETYSSATLYNSSGVLIPLSSVSATGTLAAADSVYEIRYPFDIMVNTNHHVGYSYLRYTKVTTPGTAAVGNPAYPSGLPAYVPANTTYSYGANTTATYNGVTSTFPGGYGDAATEQSMTIALPSAGNKTISYTVASGGTLKATYAADTVTGAASTAIVNGQTLSFAGGIGGLAPVTTQVLYLDEDSLFGNTCAMSKDGLYLLTGAKQYDVTGVLDVGIVSIAKYQQNAWSDITFIKAVDGIAGDNFGYCVDVNDNGSMAIIGAPYVNGTVADLGAAYLFQRSGELWTQLDKVVPATGNASELFGARVAIAGNAQVYAVSAPSNDTLGSDAGAVYAYTYSNYLWNVAKVTASDGQAGDGFGNSIKLSDDGTMLFVGATLKNNSAGAVYVFTRVGLVWTQLAKLTANDSANNQFFGSSLDVNELADVLVIGAQGNATVAGSVYVFNRVVSSWTQMLKIAPSDAAVSDGFGTAVALSAGGDVLAVGSYKNDLAATDAGAVYLFK